MAVLLIPSVFENRELFPTETLVLTSTPKNEFPVDDKYFKLKTFDVLSKVKDESPPNKFALLNCTCLSEPPTEREPAPVVHDNVPVPSVDKTEPFEPPVDGKVRV
jgi:hypothetical protein